MHAFLQGTVSVISYTTVHDVSSLGVVDNNTVQGRPKVSRHGPNRLSNSPRPNELLYEYAFLMFYLL